MQINDKLNRTTDKRIGKKKKKEETQKEPPFRPVHPQTDENPIKQAKQENSRKGMSLPLPRAYKRLSGNRCYASDIMNL